MFKSILKVEGQSRVNYLKSLETGKLILYLFLVFLILMLFLPIIWTALSAFLSAADEVLLSQATVLITLFIIPVLSLFLVNGIIKEMFMDKNIESYLVLPVVPKVIFMVKMTYQYILKVLPVVLVLGLIYGITLSSRYEAPLLIISNLAYFFLIGTISISAAYILVFIVTKISSAKRVGEVLTLVGGLASVLPYFVIVAGGQYLMDIINVMPEMDFIYRGFLYDLNMLKFILFTLISIAVGILLIFLLMNFVTNVFVKGRTNNQETKRRKHVSFKVESPIRALIKKDFVMTMRDFKEWSVVLPQYIFPFIFLYLFTSNPIMSGDDGMSSEHIIISISLAGSIMISLFVGAMNTARDASTYTFLKMMPIEGIDLAKAKYIYNALTITPMYLIIVLIVYLILDVTALSLIYALVISILVVLTVSPIGMLLGTINPVVSKKNPALRLDTAANIIISLVIFALIIGVGFVTQMMMEFNGEEYVLKDDLMLMIIVVLIITSILSYVVILKLIGMKYDKGYKITYKD